MTLVWQAARSEAQRLIDEYGTNDPYDLCRQLGIDVIEANMPDGSSGMIVKRAGQDAEVFVEADDPTVRRKFTVAHELGHYIERSLAHDDDFSFRERRGMDYNLHEFFADEFAGALLMPEAQFLAELNKGATNTSLAAQFRVSLAAVEKRRSRLMKTRAA
jgi:Zn-dependent peptidase ImmA (M78 family)